MEMFWARVLELVDNLDLKSSGRKAVRVRVSPRAHKLKSLMGRFYFVSSFIFSITFGIRLKSLIRSSRIDPL